MEQRPELRTQGLPTGARGDSCQFQANLCKAWNTCFRNFMVDNLAPRQHLNSLQMLCWNWLRPDLRSKEQILDLLVLEQFLLSSTPELQALVLDSGVQTCDELEQLLRSREQAQEDQAPQNWVIVPVQGQNFLLQKSEVEVTQAQTTLGKSATTFPVPKTNEMMTPMGSSTLNGSLHLDTNAQASLSYEPQESKPQISPEQQILQEDKGMEEEEVILVQIISGNKHMTGPPNVKIEPSVDIQESAVVASLQPQSPQNETMKTSKRHFVRARSEKRQEGTYRSTVQNTEGVVSAQAGDQWGSPAQPQHGHKRQKCTSVPVSTGLSQESLAQVDVGETSGAPRPPNQVSGSAVPVRPPSHPGGQESESQSRIPCEYCPKRFFNKSRWELHMSSHKMQQSAQQTLPQSMLPSVQQSVQFSGLQEHKGLEESTGRPEEPRPSTVQPSHSRERPFPCPHCSRAFKYMGSLTLHLRTHADATPTH